MATAPDDCKHKLAGKIIPAVANEEVIGYNNTATTAYFNRLKQKYISSNS